MNNDKTVIQPSDYSTLAREIMSNAEPIVLDGDRAVASILDGAQPIVLESDLAVASILDSARPMAELGQRVFGVHLVDEVVAHPFDRPLGQVIRDLAEASQKDFGVNFVDVPMAEKPSLSDLATYPIPADFDPLTSPPLAIPADFDPLTAPPLAIPSDFDPLTAPPLNVSTITQQVSSPSIQFSEASIKSLLSGDVNRDLDKDEPRL